MDLPRRGMKLLRGIGRSGWNLTVSSAGQLATRGLGLVYLVLLARYLGPRDFGELNALLAYFTLALIVGSFGLDQLALRDLAREERPSDSVFHTLVGLRLAASVIMGGALALIGWLLGGPGFKHLLILGIALIPAGVGSVHAAGFQARERFGDPAVAATIAAAVMLAAGLAGIFLGASLSFFLWGVVGAETSRALWLFSRAHGQGWGWRRLDIDWGFARRAVGASASYWVLAVLGVIYFRIDLVMLDAMVGGEAVGHYASAYRIMDVLALAPALLTGVLFPRFARLQVSDPAGARRLYLSTVRLLVWTGLLIAGVGALLASPLLTFLFSTAYVDATLSLLWLMLALVLVFWHAPNATILFTGGRLGPVASLSVVTAGFNVVVNWLVIPQYGAAGAAATTAASELLSLVIFTPMVCRRLGISAGVYLRGVLVPKMQRADLDFVLGRSATHAPPSQREHD